MMTTMHLRPIDQQKLKEIKRIQGIPASEQMRRALNLWFAAQSQQNVEIAKALLQIQEQEEQSNG